MSLWVVIDFAEVIIHIKGGFASKGTRQDFRESLPLCDARMRVHVARCRCFYMRGHSLHIRGGRADDGVAGWGDRGTFAVLYTVLCVVPLLDGLARIFATPCSLHIACSVRSSIACAHIGRKRACRRRAKDSVFQRPRLEQVRM